ncbi:MAG: MaoC/PaaZ C-terminal domain-containing protein [Alphaproteobacteria bacterium]|nr:MaoC/PaaZ C-terminal domain-containing protein [Alphaproteobacteria bacterium]
MTNRTAMPSVGQSVETPGRTIGECDIHAFAGLVGDFTPIHMDDVFAQSTPYGARIAHGPLTMSTMIGMATQTGFFGDRVIGLLNLNWDFSKPVKIGDTIRSKLTIEDIRATSKPGRAITRFLFDVINQDGVSVQQGRMTVMMRSD